jgi:Flp pilus assembly CpaE family ATPase
MAAALLSMWFGSCTASRPQAPSIAIAEILSTPARFDGGFVTVHAVVRDTGVHGMYIHDPDDFMDGLDLRFAPEVAQSDVVMKMTEMLLVDRERERRLGVVAEWTGSFVWRRDSISTLVVSDVRNLRWGTGLDP